MNKLINLLSNKFASNKFEKIINNKPNILRYAIYKNIELFYSTSHLKLNHKINMIENLINKKRFIYYGCVDLICLMSTDEKVQELLFKYGDNLNINNLYKNKNLSKKLKKKIERIKRNAP